MPTIIERDVQASSDELVEKLKNIDRQMVKTRNDYERGLICAYEAEERVIEILDTYNAITSDKFINDLLIVLITIRDNRHFNLYHMFGDIN